MRLEVACLCVTLLSARAYADDDTATARAHFEAGTRAYNLGEFSTAAEEYREAYKLKPDPALLYNIAQSYRLGKNIEQALFFYRSFLRNSTEPEHKGEVEERIRALAAQLAQQQAPPNDVVKPAESPGSAAPTAVELVASAPPRKRLLYKQWWVWAATVAVVGVGLGVGLGIGLKAGTPGTQLGNFRVF